MWYLNYISIKLFLKPLSICRFHSQSGDSTFKCSHGDRVTAAAWPAQFPAGAAPAEAAAVRAAEVIVRTAVVKASPRPPSLLSPL